MSTTLDTGPVPAGEFLNDVLKTPIGSEVTITFKVAGIVDFGREVQLQLPDGLLTYLPVDTFVRAIADE